jgi:hypothetical protein
MDKGNYLHGYAAKVKKTLVCSHTQLAIAGFQNFYCLVKVYLHWLKLHKLFVKMALTVM